MPSARREFVDMWGCHGDAVIVETPKPWRLILWEAAQYVPCWDLGGDVWFSPEWMETASSEDHHCWEPIMDKECRYTRASIIESGPARARIHWHYALFDNRHRIFNGNSTADEQYTVYPDGIAVRQLTGWPGDESAVGFNPLCWEVGEFILINGPGVGPADALEPQCYTFTNTAGDEIRCEWPEMFGHSISEGCKPLCRTHPEIAEWDDYIGVVHLKDRPNVFIAVPRDLRLFPYAPCSECGAPHPEFRAFPGDRSYSHWPANPATDFVGWTQATSEETVAQPSHTSFVSFGYHYGGMTPRRPTTWLYLTGAIEGDDLAPLRETVNAWLRPGRLRTNHLWNGFAYSERAYKILKLSDEPYEIRLETGAPIPRPVFGFDTAFRVSAVHYQGAMLPEDAYSWHTFQGETLLWIDCQAEHELDIVVVPG